MSACPSVQTLGDGKERLCQGYPNGEAQKGIFFAGEIAHTYVIIFLARSSIN